MSHNTFGNAVGGLEKADTLDDIMTVMSTAFADFGFFEWVYACQLLQSYVVSPVFVFMNTTNEWIRRYLEMGYHEVDPVAHYYVNNNLPMVWSVQDDWSGMGDNTVEFMKDIQSHGYAGGLCIPLFSAQNTRGFINLITRDPSLADIHAALEGRAAQIVFILRYVQESIFRVALKTDHEILHNPLSSRQKEILLWIGEGLTSKAIADKLGISYRTVESYLEEIQKKLNVSNRQQAVTRAVSLGFVLPLNLYQAPRDQAVRLVLPSPLWIINHPQFRSLQLELFMNALPALDLDKFLFDMNHAKTNASIKSTATSALAAMGFDTWIFACENPGVLFGRSQLMSGITLQWITTYLAKGYLRIDPIVRHCQESEEPLLWDAAEGWHAAADSVRDFMRDIQASGFGSGLAMPLRSSAGRVGLLSIVAPQPLAATRSGYLRHAESVQAVGLAMQAAIERTSIR